MTNGNALLTNITMSKYGKQTPFQRILPRGLRSCIHLENMYAQPLRYCLINIGLNTTERPYCYAEKLVSISVYHEIIL